MAFLLDRARRAAERRRRLYGAIPPSTIAPLISGKRSVSFFGLIRLIGYVLLGSPIQALGLFWRYLTDQDTPKRKRLRRTLALALRDRIPKARVLEDPFELSLYKSDLGRVPPSVAISLFRSSPMLVVQPRNEEEIAEIFRFAQDNRLSLFPRGVSSSAFGGTVPTENGIVIDCSHWTEVLRIDPANRTVTVRAGARWADVAMQLERVDLALLSSPTSRFSTVAGWACTGGVGIGSFRSGPLKDALLTVRVVRPTGAIESLEDPSEFAELIGTEGQLGILTELTLKVRTKPETSRPKRLTFDDTKSAFSFIEQLDEGPSHVVYFDGPRVAEENTIHKDRHKSPVAIEERDTVLLHFDDDKEEARFTANHPATKERDVGAQLLWAERFFPLKAQRIGPNLLASEVVLPPKDVERFSNKARSLARRFGVRLAIEATVFHERDKKQRPTAKTGGPALPDELYPKSCVVIAAFPCDHNHRLSYQLYLLLVQLMTHLGVRLGGKPYGIGIWNTPFRHEARPDLAALSQRKREVDPNGLLNPRKYFSIQSRFGLIGLLFVPFLHKLALYCALLFSPLFGIVARLFRPEQQNEWRVPTEQEALLFETAQRCTLCGACISTCPAYLITKDERVTGRSKLKLADAFDNRERSRDDLTEDEAYRPFQCLRCGLCEEVCQTRLPLRDCYTAIESKVDDRFQRPPAGQVIIDQFVERLDENQDWIRSTFGLDHAAWIPGEKNRE